MVFILYGNETKNDGAKIMDNCSCLTTTCTFYTVKKPNKWWEKLVTDIPKDVETLTIHGDTLKDIVSKRDDIKKQLQDKYGSNYYIGVYVK